MQIHKRQDRRKGTHPGWTGIERRKSERRRAGRKDDVPFTPTAPSEYAGLYASYLGLAIGGRRR